MTTDLDAYHELSAYTLSLGDPAFVHQHVVDAFAAQHASAEDKPIKIAFALIGLYLALERGYSGRQVQLAHMRLAGTRKQWPRFDPPDARGELSALDVLRAERGPDRERAMRDWMASVWQAWRGSHVQIRELLHTLGED
jgi:hypothetical protein